MASHEVFRCSRCGNRLGLPVAADMRCSRCGVSISTAASSASRSTPARASSALSRSTARVAPKDERNACTFFTPRTTVERQTGTARPRRPARARRSTICSSRRSWSRELRLRQPRADSQLVAAVDTGRRSPHNQRHGPDILVRPGAAARVVRRDDAAGAPAVLHADARLRDVPADPADPRRAAAAVRPDHDRRGEPHPRRRHREGVRDRSRAGHRRSPTRTNGVAVDTRIRFLGTPAGYEFISLVQAVLLAGGRPPQLSTESRARLAAVDRPVTMQVFTTPT